MYDIIMPAKILLYFFLYKNHYKGISKNKIFYMLLYIIATHIRFVHRIYAYNLDQYLILSIAYAANVLRFYLHL